MMNPNKLSFMRQTEFIPVKAFSGLGAEPTITLISDVAGNVTVDIDSAADGAALSGANARTGITGVQASRSWGAGNPLLAEVGTIGLAGLDMQTDADAVSHLMPIPSHWDRGFPIRFKVLWSNEDTTASILWKVLYTAITAGTTVLITPATALDTVIVDDTAPGTVKIPAITAAGVMDADSLVDANDLISLLVEMTTATTNSGAVFFYGLFVEYTPRYGRGHNVAEARSWLSDR